MHLLTFIPIISPLLISNNFCRLLQITVQSFVTLHRRGQKRTVPVNSITPPFDTMPVSASATTVGAGSKSPRGGGGPARPGGGSGGGIRQRKPTATTAARSARPSTSTGSMWRFYTDDSPGIKVGPVPVLVISLLFIASVFMLHIWGKYTRT